MSSLDDDTAGEKGESMRGAGFPHLVTVRAGGERKVIRGSTNPSQSRVASVRQDEPAAKVKKNVAPFSGLAVTQIRPPCRSIILRTVANPTPVPSNSCT